MSSGKDSLIVKIRKVCYFFFTIAAVKESIYRDPVDMLKKFNNALKLVLKRVIEGL